MLIKSEDSAHWYQLKGKEVIPRYEANLKDARKEGLFPGVTSVLYEKANPTLERWKQNQLLMASATLPQVDGESVDDWCERVILDSKAHSEQAKEFGTTVHNLIERILKGETIEWDNYPEYYLAVKETVDYIHNVYRDIIYIEHAAINTYYGYGCRIDLVADSINHTTIIDYKTQGTKPGKKITKYDSWCWQLAANSLAISDETTDWVNIVISSTEPGRIEVVHWTPEEIERGWKIFTRLLEIFKLTRKL